jgi:hypothetical protein
MNLMRFNRFSSQGIASAQENENVPDTQRAFFLARLSAFFSAGVFSGCLRVCFCEFWDFAMGGWCVLPAKVYLRLLAAALALVAC